MITKMKIVGGGGGGCIQVAVVLVTQMNGLMYSIDMNDKEY